MTIFADIRKNHKNMELGSFHISIIKTLGMTGVEKQSGWPTNRYIFCVFY